MASFGARLKQERERLKITLDDVAASTKIGTRMLRALEDEHFDQLPGGIFNRGFVRAYARHLGMDENQAIADYLVASGESLPAKNLDAVPAPDAQVSIADDSSPEARMPWGIIATVLIAVVLAFAAWGFYLRDKSASRETSPPPTADHAGPSGRQDQDRQNEAHQNQASEPPTTSDVQQPLVQQPLVQQPSAPPQPAPQQTAPVPASSPQQDVPTTSPSPRTFTVLVKAREESWVRITADGKEIMSGTMIAATEKSITANTRVIVRAGNAGALEFFFNEKKLPPQGDYDEVRILTFDLNGLQPTPKPDVAPPTPAPQP